MTDAFQQVPFEENGTIFKKWTLTHFRDLNKISYFGKSIESFSL
jgi:hypothetical protein